MEAKMKKMWIIGMSAVILISIVIVFSINISANSKITKMTKEKDTEIVSLQEKLDKKEVLIKEKDVEIAELSEKVDLAKPWFELAEKEQQEKIQKQKEKEAEEEAVAKKKAEKEAEEKARKEAEALKKAEEEERRGYDTGVTYDQLARNPDNYEGEKIKFQGKVIQVMEGDGETQIRIAVNNNYDTILYGAYDSSIVDSRVLEDDMVTVMGLSTGLLSYKSTMGGNITIPSMLILQVEQ